MRATYFLAGGAGVSSLELAAASAALQLRRRRGRMQDANAPPRAPTPVLTLKSQTANTEFSVPAARSEVVRVQRYPLRGLREVRRAVEDVGEERATHGGGVACAAPLRIWLRCFWVDGERSRKRKADGVCGRSLGWRLQGGAGASGCGLGRKKRAGIKLKSQQGQDPAQPSPARQTF
jgi:hypothetical protein